MGVCFPSKPTRHKQQKPVVSYSTENPFKVNPESTSLGYTEPIPYKQPKLVLIIGGGLAGMKCAYTLQKHGVDFAIIETSKQLGGRIKGTQFGGTYVEEGANWITGTKHKRTGRENPIFTLANACGLEMREVQDTSVCRDESGSNNTDYFNDQYEVMEKMRPKIRRAMRDQGFTVDQDYSVADALANNGWYATDNTKKLIEWLMWDGEHGGDVRRLSAFQNIYDDYQHQDFGKEERFVTDKRGFCRIFEVMAEEINNLTRQYRERLAYPPEPFEDNRPKGVFTNFNVNSINYEAGNVKVEATNNSNGQTLVFEGDAIVCTASIGVLRSNNLNFNPPLPKWKVDAINEVEMGNYVKIFCTFKERFWGFSEYIFLSSCNKGYFPQWMPIDGPQPMLMGVVSGDEANRIEKLDEDSLRSEILQHFKNCFTFETEERLTPVEMHVCKWMSDPRFCGSYSFLRVGSFNENPVHYHWLTAPVSTKIDGISQSPTLFFAGEAYDFNYGGQLQGAFNSGRDTAIKIIAQFNLENERVQAPPFQEFQMYPYGYQYQAPQEYQMNQPQDLMPVYDGQAYYQVNARDQQIFWAYH